MDKIRKYIFFVLFTSLFLAGCSARPVEPKLTRLTIAFQSWVGYGPFYLAYEVGFLKDEGIDLVFIDEQLDSARSDAFKEGMLDCEGATIDTLISKRARDIPVVSVMHLDHSFGADGIVAVEGINKLEDLIGKKVALARDDAGETLLSYLFYKSGLSMDKIEIVACRPEEAAQIFLNGGADAVATWEPWVSEALARKGSHLLISTKEAPESIVDVLVVREDIVRDNPRLVKGLMRAWFAALKYYKDHPDESSAIIAKYYHISAEAYRKNVSGLTWPDYAKHSDGQHRKDSEANFNALAQIKFTNKRIAKIPDAQSAVNSALLDKLYEDSR